MYTLLCAFQSPRPAAAAATSPLPSFAAPGEVIEDLPPGQPLPYLPPLPGMRVGSSGRDALAVELVALTGRSVRLGPPLLRLDYVYPDKPRLTARQITAAYRQALLQAGWKVDSVPGTAAVLVAQYAQRGRSLWIKLHAEPGVVHVIGWEPAAHVQSAALRQALTQQGQVTIYGIAFEINKDQLRLVEAEPILRQILTLLQNWRELRLEIQVHSDDSFRNVYGRRPTYDRAQRIAGWLIAHGIDASRLAAQGYGESRPVASNRTAEGRARNRRVELVRLPPPEPPARPAAGPVDGSGTGAAHPPGTE